MTRRAEVDETIEGVRLRNLGVYHDDSQGSQRGKNAVFNPDKMRLYMKQNPEVFGEDLFPSTWRALSGGGRPGAQEVVGKVKIPFIRFRGTGPISAGEGGAFQYTKEGMGGNQPYRGLLAPLTTMYGVNAAPASDATGYTVE